MNIGQHQILDVFITHVDKEGPLLKVWAQVDRTAATFVERLILQYSEQFERGIGIPHPSSLAIGQLCCAKYGGDGVYYRARIVSLVNMALGEVVVQFIDYGNCETVILNNMRSLSVFQASPLSTVDDQATDYYLAGVVPMAGEWDAISLSYIKEKLCYIELKCVIVAEVQSKKLLTVFFENTDFSQNLIEKKIAVSITLTAQQVLIQGLFSWPSPDIKYTIPPPVLVPPVPNAMALHSTIQGMNSRLSTPTLSVPRTSGNIIHFPRPMIHVPEQPRVFTIPVLEVNSEHSVFVSYIEDGPASFAVQLQVAENILNSLSSSLNAIIPQPMSQPLMPGSVCLGRFTENNRPMLCRAVVVNVMDNDCKVYCVDFGNTEVIPYSEIFELPPQYMTPKGMALRFALAGMRDLSLDDDAKNIFQEIVTDKLLTLRVVAPEGPPLRQFGELFYMGHNVKDVLLEKMKCKLLQHCYPKIPAPKIDQMINVTVSFVDTVANFYVQLESNIDTLNAIMSCVESYCSRSAPILQASQLFQGMPCCALYSADQVWYRAKVTSVSEDSVNILYVDYGNTDTAHVGALRQMETTLAKMQAQALACCLEKFCNRKGVDTESNRLEELTLEKSLVMRVVDILPTGVLVVELYDMSVQPAVNIALQLEDNPADNVPEPVAVVQVNEWQENEAIEHSTSRQASYTSERDVTRKGSSESTGDWRQKNNWREGRGERENTGFGDREDREGREKKWNNRDDRFGVERKFGNRDTGDGTEKKWVNRDDKFGGERKFSSRDERKFGNQDDENGNHKWGNRDDKFGGERKFGNRDDGNSERKWDSRDGRDGGRGKWGDRDGEEKKWNRNDKDSEEKKWVNKEDRFGGEKKWNRDSGEGEKKWGNRDRDSGDGEKKWGNRDGDGEKKWGNRDRDGDGEKKWGNRDRDGGDGERKWGNRDGDRGDRKWGKQNDDNGGEQKWRNSGKERFGSNEDRSERGSKSWKGTGGGYSQKTTQNEESKDDWNSTGSQNYFGDSSSSWKNKLSSETLPEAAVTLGATQEVELVFADNPEDFTVQVTSVSSDLSSIMERIASNYTDGGSLLEGSLLQIGTACVARYSEDDTWYRAVVENNNGDTVKVHFVDYGNHEDVPPSDVKKILPEFLTTPCLGVRCKLLGARPSSGEWSPEDLTEFLDMTDGKKLQARFVRRKDRVVEVILEDTESAVVINKNFGATDVDLKVTVASPLQNGTVSAANLIFVSDQDYAEPPIIPESTEDVTITWFVTPDEFYCQCLASYQTFIEMVNDIQASHQRRPPMKMIPTVGSVVIACFPDDSVLYRGEVVEHKGSTRCNVRYVDYGNVEMLTAGDLWQMEARFLQLPRQAVLCSLAGVQPVNGSWPGNAPQIDKLFGAKQLTCTFHNSVDGKFSVDMIQNGNSVAEELVANGLAVPVHTEPAQESIAEEDPIDLELCQGQCLSAHVTYIENMVKFFVHLEPNRAPELQSLLDQHVQTLDSTSTFPSELVVQHNLCLATPDGQQWYRSEILDVTRTSGTYVSFMDFGDCDEIEMNRMRPIPPELIGYRRQATECVLSGSKGAEISNELQEQFKLEVEDQDVILLVDGVVDGRLSVRLFDIEGQRLELIKNIGDGSLLEVEPLCPFPVLTQRTHVWVSHVQSPFAIWLQRPEVATGALADLLEQMFTFYSTQGSPLSEPQEGRLCAALSPDGNWYRGKITEPSEDVVNVIFIDYGNREPISLSDIRELDASFFSPPAMSLCVSLPVTTEDSQACSNLLREKIEDKEFDVRIARGDSEKWLGDIIDGSLNLTQLLIEQGLAIELENSPFALQKLWSPVKGDRCALIVSYPNSPTQFWIQLESKVDAINLLQEKLQSIGAIAKAYSTPPANGTLCIAIFSEDSEWYRASVLECDGTSCKVRFVDYGNEDSVDLGSGGLKIAPSELCAIPHYAIKCCLSVSPVVGTEWSAQVLERFEELILTAEEPVMVEVLTVGDPMKVDLILNDQSLSKTLIDENLAISCLQGPINVILSHVNSPNDFWIQFESTTLQLDQITDKLVGGSNFEPLSEVVNGALCAALFPEDEMWYRARVMGSSIEGTEVFYIDYGNTATVTEMRVLSEDLVHLPPVAKHCALQIPSNIKAWSKDAENVLMQLAEAECAVFQMKLLIDGDLSVVNLVLDGKDVAQMLAETCEQQDSNVIVSHINSPNEFWVQYESLSSQLDEITELLNDAESFDPLPEVVEGAMCVALFPEDEMWYRAQVLGSSSEGSEVLYIDYGNTAVSVELKTLPENLAQLPPMAKRCSLSLPSNVKEWSNNAEEILHELANAATTTFQIELLLDGDTAMVNLFHNGKDVTQALVDKCKKLEVQTSVKETSVIDCNQPEIHSSSDSSTVLISHYNSPNEFWVQYESSSQLDEITDRLVDAASFDPFPEAVDGALCAALFPDDEQWYRAKILSCLEHAIKVLFIDYGNSSSSTDLQSLPDDLLEIPPIAKCCCLPLPNGWSSWPEAAENEFADIFGDGTKVFEITVLQDGEPAIVSLKYDDIKVEEQLQKKMLGEISVINTPSTGSVNISDEKSTFAINDSTENLEATDIKTPANQSLPIIDKFSEENSVEVTVESLNSAETHNVVAVICENNLGTTDIATQETRESIIQPIQNIDESVMIKTESDGDTINVVAIISENNLGATNTTIQEIKDSITPPMESIVEYSEEKSVIVTAEDGGDNNNVNAIILVNNMYATNTTIQETRDSIIQPMQNIDECSEDKSVTIVTAEDGSDTNNVAALIPENNSDAANTILQEETKYSIIQSVSINDSVNQKFGNGSLTTVDSNNIDNEDDAVTLEGNSKATDFINEEPKDDVQQSNQIDDCDETSPAADQTICQGEPALLVSEAVGDVSIEENSMVMDIMEQETKDSIIQSESINGSVNQKFGNDSLTTVDSNSIDNEDGAITPEGYSKATDSINDEESKDNVQQSNQIDDCDETSSAADQTICQGEPALLASKAVGDDACVEANSMLIDILDQETKEPVGQSVTNIESEMILSTKNQKTEGPLSEQLPLSTVSQEEGSKKQTAGKELSHEEGGESQPNLMNSQYQIEGDLQETRDSGVEIIEMNTDKCLVKESCDSVVGSSVVQINDQCFSEKRGTVLSFMEVHDESGGISCPKTTGTSYDQSSIESQDNSSKMACSKEIKHDNSKSVSINYQKTETSVMEPTDICEGINEINLPSIHDEILNDETFTKVESTSTVPNHSYKVEHSEQFVKDLCVELKVPMRRPVSEPTTPVHDLRTTEIAHKDNTCPSSPRLPHSERIVPGSISRGASQEEDFGSDEIHSQLVPHSVMCNMDKESEVTSQTNGDKKPSAVI